MQMVVKIGSNIPSLMVQRNLADSETSLSKTFEKLSSGLRINHASDDAASLAIANTLDAHAKIYAQGARNLNDTISLYSIEKGATDELTNISIRQRELSEQSANGVYSREQLEAIDKEGRELTNEYNRIVLTTRFNGRNVFTDPFEELRSQFGIGVGNSLSQKLADELSTKATAGSYFTVNAPGNDYYVWFTVDGQGTDPGLTNATLQAKTGNRVDLYSDSSQAREEITRIAFNDASTFSWYDTFEIYSGKNNYAIWFRIDGDGTAPSAEGFKDVAVDISSSDSAAQVALALKSKLSEVAGDDFAVSSAGAGVLDIKTKDKVNVHEVTNSTTACIYSCTTLQEGKTAMDPDSIAMAVRNVFTSAVVHDGGILELTNSVAGMTPEADAGTFGTVLVDPTETGSGRAIYAMGSISNAYLEDVDNDGLKDIVTTNAFSGTVSVRINQGYGEFSDQIAYTMGTNCLNAYLRDVNNDGQKDLISANRLGGTVSVRLNQGEGLFGSQTVYTMGSYCENAYIEDVNNDGLQDLLSANYSSGTVSVRINQGAGVFGAQTAYTMGAASYAYIEDINNDGLKDLVTSDASAGNVGVRINQGGGVFGSRVTYAMGGGCNVNLQDVNNDGLKDLVSANRSVGSVSVRINQGGGAFGSEAVYSMGVGVYNAILEDINGDGLKDLITSTNSTGGSIAIRLNQGGGVFGSRTAYSMGLCMNPLLEDVNGDGLKDLLGTVTGGTGVGVRLNQGNGVYSNQTFYAMGNGCENAYLQDVNGDGQRDLITANNTANTISIRLSQGGGVFGSQQVYTMGMYCKNAFFEDIDDDGKKDILTVDSSGGTVSLRFNNGSGSFGSSNEEKATTLFYFSDGRGSCLVNHIDLSTRRGAKKAMDILDARLERLSRQTGVLGAMGSRLQIALDTINNTRENYTAAESRIMDADIAGESASMVRTQILQKVGSAVLASANQLPEIALKLLKED